MKMSEVINHSRDISDETEDPNGIIEAVFQRSRYLENVTQRLSSWKTERGEWVLVDDKRTPLSYLTLSETDIAGERYGSLDFIMTRSDGRRKHYASTLVYAVVETVGAVVIDGAIFRRGGDLIVSLASQTPLKLSVIDKNTGEREPFTGLINDLGRCYVLESSGMKFGKQLLPEGYGFTWYDFFKTT